MPPPHRGSVRTKDKGTRGLLYRPYQILPREHPDTPRKSPRIGDDKWVKKIESGMNYVPLNTGIHLSADQLKNPQEGGWEDLSPDSPHH